MKRFSEQLHTKAKAISLQEAERIELRERVISYMEYHPLPGKSSSVKRRTVVSVPGYDVIQLPLSMLAKWSGVAAVFVLIFVSVLAEKTVPGDNLYAVKVRFNEELRSTLTLTPYGRVEWETERLNRRIAEAKLLASEGKLTEEVESELAAAVKEHTESVQEEIAALRIDDADQATLASIELSTTLAVQSASLQEEGSTLLATAVDEAALGNSVQKVVDVINESLSLQSSQVESAGVPAYDKIMARVELNTTRAYELLSSIKVGENRKGELQRRLDDVGRSIEQAKSLRAENETLASEQLLDVLERTQKLIVFMSDTEGNQTIAVEAVVPIVLTEEEQKKEFATVTAEVNRKKEILKTMLPQLSAQVADKISFALRSVSEKEQSLASSSSAVALQIARENNILLTDSVAIASATGIAVAQPEITEEEINETATTTEAVGDSPAQSN